MEGYALNNIIVNEKKEAAAKTGRKAPGIKKENLLPFVTAAIIFAAWEIASLTVLNSSAVVPKLSDVVKCFIDICTDGYKGSTLLVHLLTSFSRLFSAFGIAILTAIPLGLLSGRNETVRGLLEPIIEFVRPLPPLAYYTLLILWMGIDNSSKVMLLYIACFAPIYVSCVAAVSKIPDSYTNTARILGANERQIFVRVILPYAAADIFTGIRTAIGHGYSTLVAAEMVAASSGIGWMVLDAGNWLRSDVIFVGIIVMGLTGIVIDFVLRTAEKNLIPWKKML